MGRKTEKQDPTLMASLAMLVAIPFLAITKVLGVLIGATGEVLLWVVVCLWAVFFKITSIVKKIKHKLP